MSNPPDKLAHLRPLATPEDVRSAMAQLTQLADSDVPRVPEAIFVRHVLPILTDRSGEVDVSVWLDLAGAATRPMDVVNPANEVLFRVPALMSRIPTRKHNTARESISTVVNEAQLKEKVHPKMGEIALEAGLKRHQTPRRADMETAKQWNAILVRYGYPPIAEVGEVSPSDLKAPEASKPIFSGEDDEF